MVPTYQGNSLLGTTPLVLHRAPASEKERFASTDKVRDAISSMGQASVQTINPVSSQRYLIRVQDEGKDPNFTTSARAATLAGLEAKFGKNMVVVLKTDFVGARYSQTLGRTAAFLVVATLLLILLYSTIRFKIEYAIGAVLAIMHDALIMVSFVVWTRMEFNASTIAAILTILGYSINDTIVQFDRVREERKLRPTESFKDVLDYALSVTLGRTIITTAATMLTVLSLFFFTTGDIKNFSLALFVGMVSGTYSTIYIASAFVLWWQDRADKKSPGAKVHVVKEPAAAPANDEV
jgi:preprotein translocase subunit SecF